MTKGFSTVLIGFGKVSQGYALDPAMAHFYPYATHAQVLRDHPEFEWVAVVDPDPLARKNARDFWGRETTAGNPKELGNLCENLEIAVLATPPARRENILNHFPALKAVIVEKPLGLDLASSKIFLKECRRRRILVQVNLWRRGDEAMRSLAAGELESKIGDLQAAFGVYGNGLLNNGIHMVDLVRMILGEVKAVQRLSGETFHEGPISKDINMPFSLQINKGPPVVFEPLLFENYRENGLDIWGTKGRLEILNEGLTIRHFQSCANRAMSGERELEHDRPRSKDSKAGNALYALYSNLASVLKGRGELWSSGDSALRTSQILEAIRLSPENGRLCPV
ncbi:gfo/Idh/MocA family oxidoreductase [bacterium]|nr:gfo/Idh/MocA family oxidoreductase [bacterium]